MSYTKQTREEWGKLKNYLETEFFFATMPKLAQRHLQAQHKKYSFTQMLSFFIHYKAEILKGVKDNHHLSNKLNWYLDNKMEAYLIAEETQKVLNNPGQNFKFITYHPTPTPRSPDYDIL